MNLQRLKSRMAELNMTTTQLIAKSNVSKSTILRMMHGKTDIHMSTLRMVANAVELDPSELIDDTATVPASLDISNVPEISEQILEGLTEVMENAPLSGHIPPVPESFEPIRDQMTTDSIKSDTLFVSPELEIIYERMIAFLKNEITDLKTQLTKSDSANEQVHLLNTELVKQNSRLLEQEATTRQRNRALYAGIIIATALAGLCFAGLIAYFVYDIISPTWGMVRY